MKIEVGQLYLIDSTVSCAKTSALVLIKQITKDMYDERRNIAHVEWISHPSKHTENLWKDVTFGEILAFDGWTLLTPDKD